MNREPSDMKQQAPLTEADVRRIVREEIEAAEADERRAEATLAAILIGGRDA